MKDQKPEAPKTKRVADPEILAIAAVDKALATLSPAAAERVLAWLKSKWDSILCAPITKE